MSTSLTTKQRERWKKEVEIMRIIKHQNIVAFKEIPTVLEKELLKRNPTKLPLLSMEYCQKGNLRHLIQKPKNFAGMEENDIRCIINDVVDGLEHLHKLNITHRDIKPENIVLQNCETRKGKTIYKIIDLGYAKELNDSTVSFVGTLHYLAPEIFHAKKYDHSVDYWSLGITTFEIICGILPFLPHVLPSKRFEAIKKKQSQDICIYINYSGQLTYSTEMKKEVLITNCFKNHIEVWLRTLLEFDASMRKNIPCNGLSPLKYIQSVLAKKIIKIFVLHKFEYYSYEIDDSVLVGTLKEWVSRDIKIPQADIIVLFKKELFPSNDQLLSNFFDANDYVFVVYKKNLICYPTSYTFPKLIREVMKSALHFKGNYLCQLYSETVHYITMERLTANLIRYCLQFYVAYIKSVADSLRKNYISISKKLGNLLVRIDCCTFIRKHVLSISVCDSEEYRDCLMYSKMLLSELGEYFNEFTDLRDIMKKIIKRLSILTSTWPKIVELVNNYNLVEGFNRIMNLLERTNKGQNVSLFKKEITAVVSESIKSKESLLKNEIFRAYLSGMVSIHKSLENIGRWLKQFNKNVQNVSTVYMQNEIVYWNFRLNQTKEENTTNGPSFDCLFSGSHYIQTNSSLLIKFSDLISEDLSKLTSAFDGFAFND